MPYCESADDVTRPQYSTEISTTLSWGSTNKDYVVRFDFDNDDLTSLAWAIILDQIHDGLFCHHVINRQTSAKCTNASGNPRSTFEAKSIVQSTVRVWQHLLSATGLPDLPYQELSNLSPYGGSSAEKHAMLIAAFFKRGSHPWQPQMQDQFRSAIPVHGANSQLEYMEVPWWGAEPTSGIVTTDRFQRGVRAYMKLRVH